MSSGIYVFFCHYTFQQGKLPALSYLLNKFKFSFDLKKKYFSLYTLAFDIFNPFNKIFVYVLVCKLVKKFFSSDIVI